MGAILNGLSLSKIRPFGSGLLIFSDTAARQSGSRDHGDPGRLHLHARLHWVEDARPHQPVEHLRRRAIPGLVTLRPGDSNEVVRRGGQF
jgi:transketolase